MKKYLLLILIFLGSYSTAFGASTTTVTSISIVGQATTTAITVPTGSIVIVTATMTDTVYLDSTKSFIMMLQYSLDGGVTWRNNVGCGWKGGGGGVTPNSIVNPRPSCGTNILTLVGKQIRLVFNSTSITMGATIVIQ